MYFVSVTINPANCLKCLPDDILRPLLQVLLELFIDLKLLNINNCFLSKFVYINKLSGMEI